MLELDGPDESTGQPLGPETAAAAFSLAGWTSMFGQSCGYWKNTQMYKVRRMKLIGNGYLYEKVSIYFHASSIPQKL